LANLKRKLASRSRSTRNRTAGRTIRLAATTALAEADRSKHILFYALQMFYATAEVHVISCRWTLQACDRRSSGGDRTAVSLHALKLVDEPTLIVIPEAQSLSTIADFCALMDAALAQCEELKDRFVIMDVHGGVDVDGDRISLSDPASDLIAAVRDFRTGGVGTNNLKYGAAYGPNLDTILDFAIDESAIDVTQRTNGVASAAVKLDTLRTADSRRYELAKAKIRDMPCPLPQVPRWRVSTPQSTTAEVCGKPRRT